MTIKELFAKAQAEVQAAKKLMEDNTENMTAEIEGQIEKHFETAENLKAQAEKLEKATNLEKEFNTPNRKHGFSIDNKGGEIMENVKKAFNNFVRKGKSGLKIEETKALSTLNDSEGGVLVPEDFRAQLITKLTDRVLIRQYATVINTSSGSIAFPKFDHNSSVSFTAENTQIGEQTFTNPFEKVSFNPYKLARIFRAPMELIEDAVIDVEGLLTDHFADTFGAIEENVFLNGTGTNEPLGLFNAGITTILSDETGANGVFTADDLINLVMSIKSQYRKNGVFLMHRNVVKEVRKLKDANGAYIYQPSLQAGNPSTLLGYPVLESEFAPDATQTGVKEIALFGDLKQYWIVDRVDLQVKRLTEKYAEFDQIGVQMRKRVDAAPVNLDAFKILVEADATA